MASFARLLPVLALILSVVFANAVMPAHAQAQPADATNEQLRQELETLKATVAAQALEMARQKGMIDAAIHKPESSTSYLSVLGVVSAAIIAGVFAVVAAVIAGVVAVRNFAKQAEQTRLLKAIEIIMDSRSGYQAAVRRDNLSVFLDDATKNHLQDIGTRFSGPEYTDLLQALAVAMADKATTAEQVLDIWKTALKGKKIFDDIHYKSKSTTADSGE